MAYIGLSKANIVVLKAFEAAAFVNEYLRCSNEDEFENNKYDDALEFGCQIGCITPLADDQFKHWHIECSGGAQRYNIDYLIDSPCGELYFVKLNEILPACSHGAYHRALCMFDKEWRDLRTYVLYYEWN